MCMISCHNKTKTSLTNTKERPVLYTGRRRLHACHGVMRPPISLHFRHVAPGCTSLEIISEVFDRGIDKL